MAMLLRRATSIVAAACALIIATVSLAAAQSDQSLWDKIESSGTLMCGAMASNPLGSWKIGPDQYAGYEIELSLVKGLRLYQGDSRRMRIFL